MQTIRGIRNLIQEEIKAMSPRLLSILSDPEVDHIKSLGSRHSRAKSDRNRQDAGCGSAKSCRSLRILHVTSNRLHFITQPHLSTPTITMPCTHFGIYECTPRICGTSTAEIIFIENTHQALNQHHDRNIVLPFSGTQREIFWADTRIRWNRKCVLEGCLERRPVKRFCRMKTWAG